MCSNGLDARLNSVSTGMVATKNSQDISAQLLLFCTIYTNYDHKLLAKVRKPAVLWDKFKGLPLKRSPKVFQKERERENQILVCIYFRIRERVFMLIINSGICL